MPESERASSPQPDRQRRLQATEAMRASMTHWATVRVQDERALVLPAPDLDALYAGLERALDGDWAAEYQVISAAQMVVTVQLRLGDRAQGGLGQGHTLHDARLLALADALRAYGVAPASSEGQWVEYDPDEGANTHELEPHQAAPEMNRPAAALPPEPPRDPQLERARKHIDDLVEELKGSGQGKEAARILIQRGYGNTLEESREVYKVLKALKG
jgi:hypothetical protein